MSTYLLEIIIKMITVICYMLCIINIIKIYATELVVVFFNTTINLIITNLLLHHFLNKIHDILKNQRHSLLKEIIDAINEHFFLRKVQYTIGFYLSSAPGSSFACKAIFEGICVETILICCGIVIV